MTSHNSCLDHVGWLDLNCDAAALETMHLQERSFSPRACSYRA